MANDTAQHDRLWTSSALIACATTPPIILYFATGRCIKAMGAYQHDGVPARLFACALLRDA